MIQTDLRYSLTAITDKARDAVYRIAHDGQTLNDAAVRNFEEAWADYCGAPYCLCCASGEAALEIAAHALGLRQVAVQANTLPATVRGLLAGMPGNEPDRLRLVDVDEDTGIIVNQYKQWGSELVPVMLYGRQEWTCRGGEMLIDACQAHGMKHPLYVPATGNVMAVAWSFYPTKNLGGITDGGAVTFSKGYHYARAKSYAKSIGYKGRMNELNASVLLAKLPFLDEWNAQRREVGLRYFHAIGRNIDGVSLPLHPAVSNCHLFPILVKERDDVMEHMLKAGVQVGRHYPETVASAMKLATPYHAIMGATKWCERILTLPIYPGMPNEDVDRVVESLAAAVRQVS